MSRAAATAAGRLPRSAQRRMAARDIRKLDDHFADLFAFYGAILEGRRAAA